MSKNTVSPSRAPALNTKMEESFRASLLVVTGLLRLAGVSSSEPWTRHSTDQSLLEEGMMTAESHLVSVGEGYTDEVNLPFDSVTSDPSNEGTSLLYKVSGTEPKGISKHEGQSLTAVARQPDSSEQSFSERAIVSHQNNTAITSQPLISTGVSTLNSKPFSPLPTNLATFLSREDRRGNTTAQILRISGKQPNPNPDKPEERDLLAATSFDPETLDIAREWLGLSNTPSLATSTVRILHEFPLGKNRTKPEGHFAETVETPAKEGTEKYVTDVPQINQPSQVTNQQTHLDVRTLDATRTLGSQTEAKSPSEKHASTPIFQQLFSGNRGATISSMKTMQHYTYLTLSPDREITDHVTTELRLDGQPAPLPPSQSHTDPFTFLSTPETLLPKSSQQFPLPRDVSQILQSSLPFSSQSPLFSKTDTSSEADEPLAEGMNSLSHHEEDHQMTTQVSHFKVSQTTVRKPLTVTNLPKTIDEDRLNASLPAQSDTQPPGSFPSDYGQPQVSISSTFPPPHSASSHTAPPVLSKVTFAQVELSSPVTSSAARHIMQGTSEFQLPTISSAAHREQTSPNKFVPSHIESESSTTSSDPVLTRLQRPSIHAGPQRSEVLAPSQDEPQHEAQSPIITTAVTLNKAPTLENFVSPYPEGNRLAETHSAHSKPKRPVFSTLVYGEQLERALSTFVPFLVNQQKITNSVSFHTSVPSRTGVDVPDRSSVSGLEIPGTSFLEHTKTKLPPNISPFFHDETPSVPGQVYSTFQRLSTSSPTHGKQSGSVLGITVPSEAETHVSDGSSSLADEPLHLVTSAHVGTKTHETTVEGRQPASVDAKTMRADILVSTPTKVHSQVEQQLSEVSVTLGVQSLPSNETETSTTSSFAPIQHHFFEVAFHPNLKPSRTSASVHMKSRSLETSTSTDVGAKTSNLVTPLPPTIQPQATPALHVAPHTPGKERGRNSPLPANLPASQASAYRTTPQDSSISDPSRNGPARFASPASPVSQHNKGSVPDPNSAQMEDSPVSLGAAPTLIVAGALDLVRTSEAFIQHLNRSDDLGAATLDSLVARGSLGTAPSLQSLSLLVQNAENMVCLQRMQNATPIAEESRNNRHGVASAQEMLVLSSTLGLPHFAASSVIQMSPSSVILVKPVFVFLPAETPKNPTSPSLYTEKEREHGTSPSFTNTAALSSGTSGGNQKQLVQTKLTVTTVQHPEHTTAFSSSGAYLTAKQIISDPVYNTSPKFTEPSLFRFNNLTSNQLPYQVTELSTRAKYLESKNHNNEFQLSTLSSPKVQENNSVLLYVGISVSPPDMESDLQRPQTFQPPTGQLSTPARTTPWPSLMEPSVPQILGRVLQTPRTASNPQLSTRLMLHTRNHSYGSVTPVLPTSKDFDESLRASSAENMKFPLELGQLSFSRPTSYSNLSAELFGKTLPKGQYVPIATSSSPSLPKEYQESVSLNYSSSKPMVAFPVATEMSSSPTKTAFSKPSNVHVFFPKPPMADERPTTVPSTSLLFSADIPEQTALSGKHLDDIMYHQMPSGSPSTVPSETVTHSYFAESVMEHNPATLLLNGRASLFGTGDQLEKRTSTGETNHSRLSNDTHDPVEADHFWPTVSGTESGHQSAGLVATGFRLMTTSPDNALGLVDLQRFFHKTPLHAVHTVASTSALEDTSASPVGGEVSILETSHRVLSSLLQLSAGGTSKPAFPSSSASQDQHRRVEVTGTEDLLLIPSSSLPQPASLEDDHQGTSSSLDNERTQSTASTLPTSSSMFSTLLNAPTLIMTISSSGVATHGLLGRDLNQASHLLGISQRFRRLQTQIEPTLGSLPDTSSIREDGDFSEDATSSTGGMNELHLHTVGDQAAITSNSTGSGEGETEDDSVADLPPWDSDWRAQHHRRMMRSDDVFLDSFAVVSDDACSSGNYTTEMSLRPASVGQSLSSPVTFLARIVLKDNRSHASLSIKSCCVTPTARPARPDGAACCLFPRSLVECRHIQIHQNNKSRIANFTIQLFQMLDHSVVYLHCELGICLSQQAGCKQSCVESKESPSRPSERSSYETLHNVISLGPVLKPQAEFPPGPVAGSPVAVLLLGLVLSLMGTFVFLAAIFVLWYHRRHQIKMAMNLEGQGSESP